MVQPYIKGKERDEDMDEVAQRLKDSSEACIKAYDEWNKSQKNSDNREALAEAVHELRKVASRLEIQMAVSERDESAAERISIPEHKARKRRAPEGNGDNIGNSDDAEPANAKGNGGGQRRQRTRRPNKAAEG